MSETVDRIKITNEASVVARALRELGHDNAYDTPVAPWVCTEPIVCTLGPFERESRLIDGNVRGTREVDLIVCCDDPYDAELTAFDIAILLGKVDWASEQFPDGIRLVAGDIELPIPAGRDDSGRWLYKVEFYLTEEVGNV